MDMGKSGKYIRDKRKLKGWSQEELAEKVGVSSKTISKWENGTSEIKQDNAINLSEILGVSIEEIISGRDINSITPEEKAGFDRWIKETNKITLNLEGRGITTLDIAITAFGVSIISAALALWAAFGDGIFTGFVCLLVGLIGVFFIAVGRKIIASMNKKLSERKDKISMS